MSWKKLNQWAAFYLSIKNFVSWIIYSSIECFHWDNPFVLADGTIVPCFIAADQVQTPRECKRYAISWNKITQLYILVFEGFKARDYRLNYFRIPICPEQAPEDNYFDEYVRVIKTLNPWDPLIFNCGMGAVRSK